MSSQSNSISSSSDDDSLFQNGDQGPRRRVRQSRARLCVKNKPQIRISNVSRRDINGNNNLADDGDKTDSETDEEIFSRQSAAGVSSRDLSPVDMVREYWSDCKDEMVEDMERIYVRMSNVADRGVDMVSRTAKEGVDIVKRTTKDGVEIVRRTTKGGVDIVKRTAKEGVEIAKSVPHKIVRRARHFQHCSFGRLPDWMQDNEYLQFGHRPELNSFKECFASVFGLHSETGNIWTHLIGFIAFVTAAIIFYVKPLCDQCHTDIQLREKLIFLFFFVGAILCLGMSAVFHTVCCHSEHVSKLFNKLDYVGISLLTVGSFVPWLYYSFYCDFVPRLIYMIIISVLGITTIIITMMDRFSTAEYRPVRALLFVSLGLFGVIPACQIMIVSGWHSALIEAAMHRVFIQAGLYILGAALYACRIPERFMPGKCDFWFQSHQIFHILVIAAAFVHFHGIQNMAVHRLTVAGACQGGNDTMEIGVGGESIIRSTPDMVTL